MDQSALLLINLGSPAAPTVGDVRRYLGQFLMDPYVIDLPWMLRRLLVSLILLRRPQASAEAYQAIWWPEGSPLIVISQRLQRQVQALWPAPVELAMRYGEPSIESALLRLAGQGVTRVTVAPLYPQFADSTTTTALEEVQAVLRRHGLSLQLQVLAPFYAEPAYQQALLASVQTGLGQDFDHLLLSFHGLPERHIRKRVDPIDPAHDLSATNTRGISAQVMARCYRSQCLRTAELFAQGAGLTPAQWSVSFQSRLGRAKWIGPYTDQTLVELASRGIKKLLVMCPAFVADCLETLEEIGIRGRQTFLAAGGEQLQLLPCMNDHPAWAEALVALCQGLEAQPAMASKGVLG